MISYPIVEPGDVQIRNVEADAEVSLRLFEKLCWYRWKMLEIAKAEKIPQKRRISSYSEATEDPTEKLIYLNCARVQGTSYIYTRPQAECQCQTPCHTFAHVFC